MDATCTIRRTASMTFVALLAGVLPYAQQVQPARPIPGPQGTHTENGLAGYAKILCSGVFVSGRAPEDVARGSAYFFMPRGEQEQVKWSVDREGRLARASLGETTREARYYGDQGCIIQNSDRPGSTSHRSRSGRRCRMRCRRHGRWAIGRTRSRCRPASTARSSRQP